LRWSHRSTLLPCCLRGPGCHKGFLANPLLLSGSAVSGGSRELQEGAGLPEAHLAHAACTLCLCVGHLLCQVVQVEHVAEAAGHLHSNIRPAAAAGAAR
jgi:hypothetical protein